MLTVAKYQTINQMWLVGIKMSSIKDWLHKQEQ